MNLPMVVKMVIARKSASEKSHKLVGRDAGETSADETLRQVWLIILYQGVTSSEKLSSAVKLLFTFWGSTET